MEGWLVGYLKDVGELDLRLLNINLFKDKEDDLNLGILDCKFSGLFISLYCFFDLVGKSGWGRISKSVMDVLCNLVELFWKKCFVV